MEEKRKQYDRTFKLSAVRLIESSEKPSEQVARELGISGSMLRRWRNQVREKGEKAFSESGRVERTEILRLRRENKDLRKQIEVLKKTLGFETGTKRRDTGP
jgi:transposase